MKMKMKVCFDSFDEDVASKTGNLATGGHGKAGFWIFLILFESRT